jgi:transcriptional regulator with XRE-family HTH domain
VSRHDAVRNLGPALRARREELGLSLDEISVTTRIPVAHLRAIELERPQDLPEGPYAAAYARLLHEHLDLRVADDEVASARVAEEAPEERVAGVGVPLGLVRALAAMSALTLTVLIGVRSWQQFVPEREVIAVVPDQHVEVTARRSGHLRAIVDGVVLHDDLLPGGQSVSFDGHERVELRLSSTSAFQVAWNGETLVPQGLQDHPRTLVFVDDVGPLPEAVAPDEDAPPAPEETP